MDMSTRNDNVLYRVFTRSSKRPGNFQETSSKRPANVQQIYPANVEQLAGVFWIHLLEVCWWIGVSALLSNFRIDRILTKTNVT